MPSTQLLVNIVLLLINALGTCIDAQLGHFQASVYIKQITIACHCITRRKYPLDMRLDLQQPVWLASKQVGRQRDLLSAVMLFVETKRRVLLGLERYTAI
jgi:hypothetical protein